MSEKLTSQLHPPPQEETGLRQAAGCFAKASEDS